MRSAARRRRGKGSGGTSLTLVSRVDLPQIDEFDRRRAAQKYLAHARKALRRIGREEFVRWRRRFAARFPSGSNAPTVSAVVAALSTSITSETRDRCAIGVFSTGKCVQPSTSVAGSALREQRRQIVLRHELGDRAVDQAFFGQRHEQRTSLLDTLHRGARAWMART